MIEREMKQKEREREMKEKERESENVIPCSVLYCVQQWVESERVIDIVRKSVCV